MENHTKRIRKARRQGLVRSKEVGPPTRRTTLRGRGMAGADVPGEPRAHVRRSEMMSKRKAERAVRGGLRRAHSAVARARAG